MTGHLAPWPLQQLDVADARKAGHEPVPFQQFILKIHSRCNLACTYCYVYEMADQGWREMPRLMSPAVTEMTAKRIDEHVQAHHLPSVDVILHGGEPLLAGTRWLTELTGLLRAQISAQVNLTVQTNGTLLRRPMLETLRDLGIRVGVSLDGDAEATGRHRLYPSGRNSYAAVADGLHLLGSPEFREIYGGILCAIDVSNDPIATYESLLKFDPPAVDLLLPHANWSSPPPGSGYADWLIEVFERWYSAPVQETQIRLFTELIQLILGGTRRGGRPGPAAGNAHRGRHRRHDQTARLAELGLCRRRRHRAARPHRLLRRRARPSHHGGQADGCRRLVRRVPGLPGHGDLRWRPLSASLPPRRGIPQPLGLLRRPDAADHPRQRAGDQRPGRPQYGSISAVSLVPS